MYIDLCPNYNVVGNLLWPDGVNVVNWFCRKDAKRLIPIWREEIPKVVRDLILSFWGSFKTMAVNTSRRWHEPETTTVSGTQLPQHTDAMHGYYEWSASGAIVTSSAMPWDYVVHKQIAKALKGTDLNSNIGYLWWKLPDVPAKSNLSNIFDASNWHLAQWDEDTTFSWSQDVSWIHRLRDKTAFIAMAKHLHTEVQF